MPFCPKVRSPPAMTTSPLKVRVAAVVKVVNPVAVMVVSEEASVRMLFPESKVKVLFPVDAIVPAPAKVKSLMSSLLPSTDTYPASPLSLM